MYNDYFDIRDKYLEHYGVKGMKWRFRRFTNMARLKSNQIKNDIRKGVKNIGDSIKKSSAWIKYNPRMLKNRVTRAVNILKMRNRTKAIAKDTGTMSQFQRRLRLTINPNVKTRVGTVNGQNVYGHKAYVTGTERKHSKSKKKNYRRW